MARPQLKIDAKKVRQLAGAGLTTDEIAAFLDCSPDTLERRYAGALKGGRKRLCASLKRKQAIVALRGNVTMLIWLGKQYLGQRDQAAVQVETTGRRRLEIPDRDERFEPAHQGGCPPEAGGAVPDAAQ